MSIIKISTGLKNVFKLVKRELRRMLPTLCFRVFSLLPVKQNVAVFESYRGESFSGNPKYILKELQRRTNFRCVVFVKEPSKYQEFDNDIKFVKRLSIEYIYWLARAKYIVNNVNYPDFLRKREGTFHVQTMHGTPLKLMGSDLINKTDYAYSQNLLGLYYRSKRWDLLVSPNHYTTDIFKRVFKYSGEVLECGYPRNDLLVNNTYQATAMNEMKSKLGIEPGKKVILFAPTWRENSSIDNIQASLNLDFELMHSTLSEEYVVIMRLHHLVSSSLDVSKYEGFIYDFSGYPDSQELLIASDMLITDYSSIMFDYLNYKKPIILYLHDYDDYMRDRGAYFDIRSGSLGTVVYSFNGLLEEILNPNLASEYDTEVYEKFCHAETGKAAEQVVNRMLSVKGN